jgi:hypothetical protein
MQEKSLFEGTQHIRAIVFLRTRMLSKGTRPDLPATEGVSPERFNQQDPLLWKRLSCNREFAGMVDI